MTPLPVIPCARASSGYGGLGAYTASARAFSSDRLRGSDVAEFSVVAAAIGPCESITAHSIVKVDNMILFIGYSSAA